MGRNLFSLEVMGKIHPHLREKNWKLVQVQTAWSCAVLWRAAGVAFSGMLNAALLGLLSGNFVECQGGISSNTAEQGLYVAKQGSHLSQGKASGPVRQMPAQMTAWISQSDEYASLLERLSFTEGNFVILPHLNFEKNVCSFFAEEQSTLLYFRLCFLHHKVQSLSFGLTGRCMSSSVPNGSYFPFNCITPNCQYLRQTSISFRQIIPLFLFWINYEVLVSGVFCLQNVAIHKFSYNYWWSSLHANALEV